MSEAKTTNIMKFKCLVCNGEGEIVNENFEACAKATRDEWLNSYGAKPGDCKHCQLKYQCDGGEKEECYNCLGSGFMQLDLNNWKYVPNTD